MTSKTSKTNRNARQSVWIVGVHADGTECPLSGSPHGQARCCEQGGPRVRVRCDLCRKSIPAVNRLDAVETKAIHAALHERTLTFRYIVDDGDGPKVIRQTRTLVAA
ncbi:hypothetical protein ACIQU4_28190 [Streptomyces sp. NPDC090741]|uniref:hypothetical protein n=1 Tax=Streptomyces sp. NPDC090741 TaxID=3365967 RepID=UPI00382B9044